MFADTLHTFHDDTHHASFREKIRQALKDVRSVFTILLHNLDYHDVFMPSWESL